MHYLYFCFINVPKVKSHLMYMNIKVLALFLTCDSIKFSSIIGKIYDGANKK